MQLFVTAYILLALASWSALAAPISSGSARDYVHAQKRSDSLSSSIHIGRQQQPRDDFQPLKQDPGGPPPPPPHHDSTMGCDQPKSKSSDYKDIVTPSPIDYTVVSVPKSEVGFSKRRLRSAARRPGRRAASPSIFERENDTPADTSSPITVRDILDHYLQQRTAPRPHGMKSRTNRNAN